MKNLFRLSFLLGLLFPLLGIAQDSRTVDLDVPSIKDWLANAPNENSAAATTTAIVIDLPLANGESVSVKVLESPILLNSKSSIRTYSFIGFDDPSYSGRLMVSDRGIDAHMFTPDGRFLIKPITIGAAAHQINLMTGEYPHLANDALSPDGITHKHQGEEELHQHDATARNLAATPYNIGGEIRKFRMHVIADKEYATAATNLENPTRAQVLEAITAAVNSMNAFYVRGMAVLLTLDEASQTIYIGDNPSGFIAQGALQSWHTESLTHHGFLESNTTSDGIGGTNPIVPRNSYDVGHLFSGRVQAGTGGGGVAFLAAVCTDDLQNGGPLKAGGGSGIPDPEGSSWVDLLAHEFTHQFNADHTWSGQAGFCSEDQFSCTQIDHDNNPNTPTICDRDANNLPLGVVSAYEPGGGSTIVSYADICSTDNVPNLGNSSYYHTHSIKQVDDWIENNADCEVVEASGNQVPVPSVAIAGCTANYTIPPRTPFYIEGSATDDTPDQLTYTWEQYNLAGDQFTPITGPTLTNPNGELYPIFRSFAPTSEAGRSIPQASTIASGNYNGDAQTAANLTQANWQGELLPEVTGKITMRLTVRDNNPTAGGVEFADTDITVAGSMPFSVTSQNSSPATITAGGTMNVNWTLAGTDAAPFNHSTVTIKLSVDGGLTFPTTLGTSANTGSATVTIPSGVPGTTTGRVRVEVGTDCFYFFDINNADFAITSNCGAQASTLCPTVTLSADSGDSSFDLDESVKKLGIVNSKTLTIPTDSNIGASPTVTSENCSSAPFNFRHGFYEFQVTQDGAYTVASSVQTFLSIFQTDSYVYNANDPCGSFTFVGASREASSTGTDQVTVNLQKCVTYTAVVGTAGGDTNMTISGPGDAIEEGSLASGTSYTYIAVNQTNNQVAEVNASADFTSLAGSPSPGTSYEIYGVSYSNSETPADWTSLTSSQLLDGTRCLLLSSNASTLTVTGEIVEMNPCDNTADKTITSTDIADAMVDTISNGGAIITSGTLEIPASRSIALLAGSSVTLNDGFHAQAGSELLVKIGCVNPTSLQEEEPVLTVYRYSPETEEVVAIATKPTVATTSLATPSFSELDLTIAPNPARDFTNLTFSLGKASTVNLTIYDMSGRAVESMVQGQAMSAGLHQIQYTPQSIKGGMYYVVLQADNEVVTKKMILVR